MKKEKVIMTLPFELIEEILLRLSVKSLLRFKCVCKSWLCLISDSRFAKSHFDVAATMSIQPRLFTMFSRDSKANSRDIDDASFDNDSSRVVVFNLPNPSPSPSLTWQRLKLVGSCRGFLLLTVMSFNLMYAVIWNPSTGAQKRFHKLFGAPRYNKRHNLDLLHGIGYDSSTNDIIVTVIVTPLLDEPLGMDVHYFSLRTNSWSCMKSSVSYKSMGFESQYGLLLNDALHWLVYDNHHKIIAFDLIEKRILEIPLAYDLGFTTRDKCFHLKVMEGCLCLWYSGQGPDPAEMWTMKIYKMHSSWTHSFKIFIHTHHFEDWWYFHPVCITKNGDVLGYDNRETLVRYNDKVGYMREVHKRSLRKSGQISCCVYIESLLSPSSFN